MENFNVDKFAIFQITKMNQKMPMAQLFLKMPPLNTIAKELRQAILYFKKFKMSQTTKWLAELLNSRTRLDEILDIHQEYIESNTEQAYVSHIHYEDDVYDEETADTINLISTLFELSEYKKAAFIASNFITQNTRQMNEVIYYYTYSNFLHETMRREEEIVVDSEQTKRQGNFEVSYDMEKSTQILEEIQAKGTLSVINKYVLGLIYVQKQQMKEAQGIFLEILNQNPFFWSAWLELQKILVESEDIDAFDVLS